MYSLCHRQIIITWQWTNLCSIHIMDALSLQFLHCSNGQHIYLLWQDWLRVVLKASSFLLLTFAASASGRHQESSEQASSPWGGSGSAILPPHSAMLELTLPHPLLLEWLQPASRQAEGDEDGSSPDFSSEGEGVTPGLFLSLSFWTQLMVMEGKRE